MCETITFDQLKSIKNLMETVKSEMEVEKQEIEAETIDEVEDSDSDSDIEDDDDEIFNQPIIATPEFLDYRKKIQLYEIKIAHQRPLEEVPQTKPFAKNKYSGNGPRQWMYGSVSEYLFEEGIENFSNSHILEDRIIEDIESFLFRPIGFTAMLYNSKHFHLHGFPSDELYNAHKNFNRYFKKVYKAKGEMKHDFFVEMWFFPIYLSNQTSPKYRKGSVRFTYNVKGSPKMTQRFQTMKWANGPF